MTSNPHGDKLVRHSLLLLVAQQLGNASTMGYQIVMGRSLSPREYAILTAMLGVVLIIGTPLVSVQTALAHFSARLAQAGRKGDLRALLKLWYGYMALAAAPLTLVGILGSGPISAFFHLDSRVPVIITALILGLSFIPPVLMGALQGVQAFIWFSVTGYSWGVVRLVAGIILVYAVSATAVSGLTAQLLAVLVTIGCGLYALHRVLRGEAPGTEDAVRGVRTYALRSFFILAGFAVLMNADIVLVKRFLPGSADVYAPASTIGRSIVFFPTPIIAAMFPKVTSAGATTQQNWRTLATALVLCVGVILAMVLAGVWLPRFPLWIMFNNRAPSAEEVALVRGVLVAMSPLGLVNLLTSFELAQHRFGATFPLLVCAAGFVGGVAILHRTAWDVIYILGAMSILAAILLVLGLPWKSLRQD